jgi:hypothetical protein
MEIGAVLERVGHISAVRSDPAADADLRAGRDPGGAGVV